MPFEVGQRVRLRRNAGEVGHVVRIAQVRGSTEAWYKVRFGGGESSVPESGLAADSLPASPRDQLIQGHLSGPDELRVHLTGLRLQERNLTDQLRSLRAARLQHLPYQYKPLLKLLESEHRRILIADEVGLGKTIEAGLIISELRARQDLRRVLIVVPANLLTKWQRELRERFDQDFEIRDSRWLRDVLLAPATDGTPPAFQSICSIEALRSFGGAIESVQPVTDLVVVDEAHRLRNESTNSYRAVRALSEAADAVVLCSATPIQTSARDLHNLMRVMLGEEAGTPSDFDRDLERNRPLVRAIGTVARTPDVRAIRAALRDVMGVIAPERKIDREIVEAELAALEGIQQLTPMRRAELLSVLQRLNVFGSVLTRTRKRDVMPNRPERKASVIDVEFTRSELALYREVVAVARNTVARYGPQSGSSLAMIMRARQAASCLAAFRAEMLSGAPPDPNDLAEVQDEMDLEDAESNADEDPAEVLRQSARRHALPSDSKLDAVLAFLDELSAESNPKAVLFSTFRGTIGYLSRKLTEGGIVHVTMSGEIADRHERDARIRIFRDNPACRVLLTTEVGGEGIDLQFCDTLINYDLPWNPMVVEQRIGRLDRLGQASPIIRIANVRVADTIEARILDRLYDRIEIFRDSVGPLEAILGDQAQKLALELFRLDEGELEGRLNDSAMAIENARLAAERLANDAAQLLGDDVYYEQRLAEIEERQGNIANDLLAFVRAFLGKHFSHAQLVEGKSAGMVRLTADSGLLAWLQKHANTEAMRTFTHRYARSTEGLAVTFAQTVAEARPDLDFFTSTHPLVQAFARETFQRPGEERAFAFSVRLPGSELDPLTPADHLILLVAIHEITGIRPRREVASSAIEIPSANLLTWEAADKLLLTALRGRFTAASPPAPATLEVAFDACDEDLAARLGERAGVLRGENELFVQRRIANLELWFRRRIRFFDSLATSHSDERVRKMNAGRAAVEKARLVEKIAEARSRDVDVASTVHAVVVIERQT